MSLFICLFLISSFQLGELKMKIPNNFQVMSKEEVNEKYPLKAGKKFVAYQDASKEANLIIEQMPNTATEAELEKYKAIFEAQFNHPQIAMLKSSIEKVNGHRFIVLEMLTPYDDGSKTYNLMYIGVVKNQLYLATFNCPERSRRKWQQLAYNTMNTIKVL